MPKYTHGVEGVADTAMRASLHAEPQHLRDCALERFAPKLHMRINDLARKLIVRQIEGRQVMSDRMANHVLDSP